MELTFTFSFPGLVLVIVGLVMVINPRIIWMLETKLYMKSGKASDTYINVCRTGGFFFLIWGIALFLGAPLPGQLY